MVVNSNLLLDKFTKNRNKYIIQIGQQLRKVTSIYLLKINNFKKLWLTGTNNFKHMEYLLNSEQKFLKRYITRISKRCVEMKYLKNIDEYDELLTKNIVFVDLFDASANNTVLECIVRNTPIVINKINSVVEYLGEAYPLYFEDISQINSLLTLENITKSHIYLQNMDKSDITLESFTKNILSFVDTFPK